MTLRTAQGRTQRPIPPPCTHASLLATEHLQSRFQLGRPADADADADADERTNERNQGESCSTQAILALAFAGTVFTESGATNGSNGPAEQAVV